MDSDAFAGGVLFTVVAIGIAIVITFAAYTSGKNSIITELKHYGCEKVLAFHEGKP